MTLQLGTSSNDYSLLTTTGLLWANELYLLSVLVVGFSIIFPLAKLIVLWSFVITPKASPRRQEILAWVERFGKWSMLDIYLVCLIMTLTSNQFFVGSIPLIGTPLFIIAIVFGMIAGEIIAAQLISVDPHNREPVTKPPVPLLLLLLFSVFILFAVLITPFLTIDDWLLRDYQYSIISLIPTLYRYSSTTMAITVGVFLVIMPIWSWAASVRLWFVMRNGIRSKRLIRLVRMLRRWSMLDVFGLALGVFLVEGKHMMTTEVNHGALLLVAGLACGWLIQLRLDHHLAKLH